MSEEYTESTPLRPRRRPRLASPGFVLLLLSQAGFGFAFSGFFLLPTFLATELAVGPASIGLLTTVTSLATVLCMVVMGSLADRRGRSPLLFLGAVLMALASLGFIAVDSMGVGIYVLRALQALAFSMVYVAGAAMTVDLAPEERLGEALGYFGLTGLAMNAVAPVVMESLAAGPGWDRAFVAAALGAIACAALAAFVAEPKRPSAAHHPEVSSLELLRQPRQIGAAVVMTCVGANFATLFVYHQLYALELGIDRVREFFVAYALAAFATRLLFGSLGDRWGRRPVSAASLALYAAATFGMLELGTLGLAAIGGAFGLAHGIFYPTYSAYAMETVTERGRGRAVALLQAWFNVGVAGSSYFLGHLAETAGYPSVFAVAGACTLIAFCVVASSRSNPLRRSRGSDPLGRTRPPARQLS